MLSYLILTLILIGISIGIYRLYKDFFSPSFLYSLAMTLSSICSIIGLMFWNNQEHLQFKAILIIILSVLSFALGEMIIRKIFIKKANYKKKKIKYKLKKIAVKKYIIVMEIIFVILTCVLFYKEVKRISIIGGYSGNNLTQIVYHYRKMTSLVTTELLENGQGLNFVVSQMKKLCYIIGYINIFILINNIILKYKKNYTNVTSAIILMAICFLILLSGGRMQYAIYAVSTLFMTLFILMQKKDFNIIKIVKKYWKRLGISFLSIFLLFYLVSPLTGRKLDNNLAAYFSFYFGAPIPSLNYYLNEDKVENKVWGQETFQGLQAILYKLKLSNFIAPTTTEWVQFKSKNSSKIYSSNIFTSAKRYYNDFGFLGVIICQMFFSMVFTGIYLFLKLKPNTFLLILFSMYYYIVIDQIRDDLFYASVININLVINILGLALLCYFIINEKINLPFKKCKAKS